VTVSRLRHIPGIGVNKIGDAADAANDPDLLRLENLDTDIRPPQVALEVTLAAVHDDAANSYLPFQGHRALRAAAAAHVGRLAGRHYDPDAEVVGVAGGLNGVLNTLLALVEPGQEVVIADPIYAGLVNRVRLAGGVPRHVPATATPLGWMTDPERLAEHFRKHGREFGKIGVDRYLRLAQELRDRPAGFRALLQQLAKFVMRLPHHFLHMTGPISPRALRKTHPALPVFHTDSPVGMCHHGMTFHICPTKRGIFAGAPRCYTRQHSRSPHQTAVELCETLRAKFRLLLYTEDPPQVFPESIEENTRDHPPHVLGWTVGLQFG